MRTPSFRHSQFALCALLALRALPANSQVTANTLPVVRPGGAVINASVAAPSGNTLNITQTPSATNRGLIEWSSFSIGDAARVNITQPNAQSLLVNRVVGAGNGPSASQINGMLTANGRVMLVNPAGVMFGAKAQVSAGSLVAAALDLDDPLTTNNYAALIQGDDISLKSSGGSILVEASDSGRPQIEVSEGGSISLIGGEYLTQAGSISAPGGHIDLAVAWTASLQAVGNSGFVKVLRAVWKPGPFDAPTVLALGPSSATVSKGGSIVIGAQGAGNDATGTDIRLGGIISADSDVGNAGSVRIDPGSRGSLQSAYDATISASSTATGGRGGSIGLFGPSIEGLRNGSGLPPGQQGYSPKILTDGRAGGGTITIGDASTRAVRLFENFFLSADATDAGDGGTIRVQAMYSNPLATAPMARVDYGVAEIYGRLHARGGPNGGNGGHIETSGMALTSRLTDGNTGVTTAAVIDASARSSTGHAGTWTLDPFNVTISNAAPTSVNGFFNPTGPGANVNAGDITAALNNGTSVEISTEAGGAGTDTGNITVDTGTVITRTSGTAPATLTLRANNNITFLQSSGLDAGQFGAVNLNLFSDLDGNGSGGINILGANIVTRGGNIVAAGGLNPAAGYARGDASNAGISITAGAIDTRDTQAGTAGDIVLRGVASATPSAPAGVRLSGAFTFGSLSVDGRASHGTGVSINGAILNSPGTGNIDVRGLATRIDTATGSLIGVDVDDTTMVIGSGALTLAGRGDDANIASAGAVGLRVGDLNITGITGTGGAPGTVTLVGQSTGNSIAPGLQIQTAATTGLVVRELNSAPTNVNLVIGALSDVRASSLELGAAGPAPSISVTDTVNIRPLGVDASTGAVVEQASVPITIIPRTSNAGANTFQVQADMLANGSNISADLGVVVGSRVHTGAITVDTDAFANTAPARLTLQNEGGGSQGITIGAGNTFGTLGLLSAGNIGETASGFTTQNLVIRGGAATTVTLDSNANQINGVLAFDPPASLTVRTAGGLTVDAASTATVDPSAADPFALLILNSSVGGNTALLNAGGNVTINQSISMAGTGAPQLNIVSPTSVTFGGGATLTSGGGRWRVWAPNVVNAPTAGSPTNLYGCVFGDTTTCSVSGIAIPTTGNQFLRPTRPTLTIGADDATGLAGLAFPAFTYTALTTLNGDPAPTLVNGDTLASAVAGSLATNATSASAPGTYAITQGSLVSPLGYVIQFEPGTLTLEPSSLAQLNLTRVMLQSSTFRSEISSEVYGRNLDQPFVCTAASVMRGGLAAGDGADTLASEWGKVRNQPQLSGCLNVSDGGSCSAF